MGILWAGPMCNMWGFSMFILHPPPLIISHNPKWMFFFLFFLGGGGWLSKTLFKKTRRRKINFYESSFSFLYMQKEYLIFKRLYKKKLYVCTCYLLRVWQIKPLNARRNYLKLFILTFLKISVINIWYLIYQRILDKVIKRSLRRCTFSRHIFWQFDLFKSFLVRKGSKKNLYLSLVYGPTENKTFVSAELHFKKVDSLF